MEKLHSKPFTGTPFHIETESIENQHGTWNSTKVSIFRDGNLIGEYLRNYGSFAALTFYPFQISNEWYALYSANYTTTRVMKLHKDRIEDWCGEESPSSFCPAEIYVPRYNKFKDFVTVDNNYANSAHFLNGQAEEDFLSTEFCNFGFLCGSVWGDDTTWKLRYIELSKVPDKVLNITERFGYWELPSSLTLSKCIDMIHWEPNHQIIRLTRAEYIRLDK